MKHPTTRAQRLRTAAAELASFPPARILALIVAMAIAAALAGCGTVPTTVEVRVPVPVVCREAVPPRPVMPTEGLQPAASLTDKVKALLAETELREGYEVRLVAALEACTRPLQPVAGAPDGH
ncbi:MAG TPA: hypothetical protein VEB23_10100 [Ramlibacter sp.]|nr:hypothetical protein [Ramlibacter sp.]